MQDTLSDTVRQDLEERKNPSFLHKSPWTQRFLVQDALFPDVSAQPH